MRERFRIFAEKTSHVLGSVNAFLAALVVVVAWALSGPAFHFSNTWQLIINTATTLVTFLMVFVIQHTQNRDALALQLKLDEIIRALHGARNELINVEHLPDDKLADLQLEFERLQREYGVFPKERLHAIHHRLREEREQH